jgi:hypothetical protein
MGTPTSRFRGPGLALLAPGRGACALGRQNDIAKAITTRGTVAEPTILKIVTRRRRSGTPTASPHLGQQDWADGGGFMAYGMSMADRCRRR